MRRIIYALVFISSISYADDNIDLIPTDYTKKIECRSFNSLKSVTKFDESKQFSIPDEDYVIVSFFSKNNKKCYSMKYYPDMSPYLQLKLSNKKIIVKEIPSIATGYRFYKLYEITKDHQKLIYKDTIPIN